MIFEDREYALIMGSDVDRDGMFLELVMSPRAAAKP
jgi:hypothetical protein